MSELGIFGALHRLLDRPRIVQLRHWVAAASLALSAGAALAGTIGQANIVGGENQLAAPGNSVPNPISVRNDGTSTQNLRVYIQFDSTSGATLNSGQTSVDIGGVPAGETRTVTLTLGGGTGSVTIASCALDGFGACAAGTEDSTLARTATLAGLSASGNVDPGDGFSVQVEAENGGSPTFGPVPVTFTVTGPASPSSFNTVSDYLSPATLNLTIDPAAPGGSVVTVRAERTDVDPRPPAVVYTYVVNDYQLIQLAPPDGTQAAAGSVVALSVRALFNGGPPDDGFASRQVRWDILADPSGNSRLTGNTTSTTTSIAPGDTDTSIDLTIGAPNTTAATITVRATAFEPNVARIAGAIAAPKVRTVDFVVDPFDALSVTATSGGGQSAAVGDPVTNPLVVAVTRNGQPDAGSLIDWSVSPANAVTFTGGASTAQSTVDPSGNAQIAITRVNADGPITITAAHNQDPAASATFGLTGTNPVFAYDTISGDNQSAATNTAFASPLRLRVLRNGSPESNAVIDWSVSPSGAVTLDRAQTTTDVNGFAQVFATAGAAGGPVTVTASRADDPTTTFTYTLLVVARELVKPSSGSGDGQNGVPGQPAPQPLAAQALLNGNPESGVTVNWSVLSGDATLTGVTNPTDNGGLSTAQVVFGPSAGPVTVQAQRADVPSEVQTYNLTAADTRTLEKPQVGSGDGQTAPIGSTLPERLVVIARNNAIAAPGVEVLWSVTGGTATLSPNRSTTGPDGSTSIQVTFGNVPGTVTVRATRADDPNASSSFVLTATSSTQPNLSLEKPDNSGDGTSAPVGTDVMLQARAVIGTSPQADIEVLWELVSGSARVSMPRSFSDRQGLVSTTVTLGPNAGSVVVRAVRTDSGASQTYQLTATGAGGGALLEILDGNNQTGAPGSAGRALRVRLSQNGQALANQTVSWTVLAGSATLDGPSSSTNANGEALMGITFGTTPGEVQVRASAAGATALFSLRVGTPGAMLALISGNRQTGVVGTRAAQPIVVELTDGLGAPLANQTIDWRVLAGSATLDTATTTTGEDGRSSQGLRFGNTAGPIRLRAEVAGRVPEVFVEIEAAAIAPTLTIVSGNNQSAPAGSELPQDFVVAVAAPAGGGLGGVTVRWQVTAGGGTLAAATTTTGADGRAGNRLTLGPNALSNTVTATVDGAGSVTFSATGNAPAGPLTIVSGNNQTLPTRKDSAPLVVELKNTAGVPIRDATLLWTGDNAQPRTVRTTTDQAGRSENVAQVLLPGAARVTVQVEGGTGAASAAVSFTLTGGVANIPQLGEIEETIGGAIDRLCPALVGLANPSPEQADLRARCLELVNNAGTNPQQVENALDQLREDVALAQASAALLTAATQFDNLKTRIAALRSGARGADLGGLAIANSSGVMPLSFLPSAVVQAEDGTEGGGEAEVGSEFSRWGFFASGIIGRGEQEAGRVTPEYDFDTSGLTAGVDYRINDRWIVGASLGFNKQDTDLADDGGGIDTDGWSVSGYTTWYQENDWYVDGVLTVGSNDYDMSRSIVYDIAGASGLTRVNQVAQASTSGDVLSAAFSVGRDFNRGPWNFGPYFRGTYTAVDFDRYEEELGSGIGSGLGLAVESRELKSMTGVLGGKVTYTMSRDWGILMPHAQLEWEHEFRDDPQSVVTRFLHDPTGTRVRLDGDEVDTDYYNIGFGLSALFPGGRSAFFYYEHLAGSEGLSQDNLSIGVRIEF